MAALEMDDFEALAGNGTVKLHGWDQSIRSQSPPLRSNPTYDEHDPHGGARRLTPPRELKHDREGTNIDIGYAISLKRHIPLCFLIYFWTLFFFYV